MDILKIAAIAVAGYILGSINIAVIVSYLFFKGDIRDKGSHNAGSTNMARVYGFGAGILTFGGDVVKTILAMLRAVAVRRYRLHDWRRRLPYRTLLAGVFQVQGRQGRSCKRGNSFYV